MSAVPLIRLAGRTRRLNTDLSVPATTEATSSTIGALIIAGGGAFAKNVVVGGQAGSEKATLTAAASIATDANNGNVFEVELDQDSTLAAPSNLISGFTYIWIIKQPSSGGPHTLAYNAVFLFPGGTPPTLSIGGSAIDCLTAVSDGTNLLVTSQLDFS